MTARAVEEGGSSSSISGGGGDAPRMRGGTSRVALGLKKVASSVPMGLPVRRDGPEGGGVGVGMPVVPSYPVVGGAGPSMGILDAKGKPAADPFEKI